MYDIPFPASLPFPPSPPTHPFSYFLLLCHRLFHSSPPLQAETGVITATFAAQWFLTNFLYSFPFYTAVRVWDMFLCDGNKALYRVGLAVLESMQGRLCSRREGGQGGEGGRGEGEAQAR